MLHSALLLTAVALVGLTSATTPIPSTCDVVCKTDVLGVLLGRCRSKRLTPGCVDDVAADASAFCSSFVAPVTVSQTTLGTTTQAQSVTATETATTTATETTSSTSTTTITFHEAITETSTTATSTSTSTTSVVSFQSFIQARGVRPTSCPKLSTARLQRLAPEKVSSVCSLLGVTPLATTVTGTGITTATSTATASTETTTSATTITTLIHVTEPTSSTLTTTTTTTTSVVAAATEVTTFDPCVPSLAYIGNNGSGTGNTVEQVEAVDAPDCCRKCWGTTNCIISAHAGGLACLLVVKTPASPLVGGFTNAQCPLGKEVYARSTDITIPRVFFDGPCATPEV